MIMKIQQYLILAVYLLLPVLAPAQELEVKDFTKPTNDPAATQYPVKDINNKTCALIVVGLAADDATFEGAVKQEKKTNGQYWVYFTEGQEYTEITAKGYLPKLINFSEISNFEALESAQTYYLNIEVPLLEKSFDELLADARKYYDERADNTRFNYYDAAKIAYEKAIEHNDCPLNLRDTLKTEYNDVLFMRKYTHHHESATDSISKYASLKGNSSDDVFKWLLADHKILGMLLDKHPEMTALATADADVQQRISRHPKGTTTVKQEVTMHRQRITGTITLSGNYTMPLNSISIYASPYATVKKDSRASLKLLGKANAKGEFNVIMPTGMNFIITSAEMTHKADAHYVSPNDTKIDIYVK